MANIINGSNVVIKFKKSDAPAGSEQAIACATSCTVNINQDFKDIACKPDDPTKQENQQWKTVTPGIKSWDMSADALYVDDQSITSNTWETVVKTILASDAVDVVLEVHLFPEGESPKVLSLEGSGFIASTSLTAAAKEDSTFSMNITGSGELKYVDPV